MLFRGNASTEARCHTEEFYCSEWAQAHIIQGLSMSYKKVNAERTLTVTWYPSSLACAPADRNGRCHPSFRLPGAHSPCGSLNFLLLRWKAFKEMKETLQESLRTGKINSCSKQTSNYPAPKRRNVVWKLKKTMSNWNQLQVRDMWKTAMDNRATADLISIGLLSTRDPHDIVMTVRLWSKWAFFL